MRWRRDVNPNKAQVFQQNCAHTRGTLKPKSQWCCCKFTSVDTGFHIWDGDTIDGLGHDCLRCCKDKLIGLECYGSS